MKISTITLGEAEDTFVLKFKLMLKKVGISTQSFKHFKTTEDALTFYSGHEMIDTGKYSICFIDVNLKGLITVVDLVNQLKALHGKVYLGIISNSGGIIAQNAASRTGANFFMTKNGDYEELANNLKRIKVDFIMNVPPESFKIYE